MSVTVEKDLDEEITCSFCLEYFTDPRLLPCGHYYCKDCIRQIAASGSRFPCPQCRSDTVLPQNDPGQLPTASFVNRMKDMHAKIEKVKTTTTEQPPPYEPPPYQPPTLPPYQQQLPYQQQSPYQQPAYRPPYQPYQQHAAYNQPYPYPQAAAQPMYRPPPAHYQKPPYQAHYQKPSYQPQPMRPMRPMPPMPAMPSMQQQSALKIATGSGVLTINTQQGARGQSTVVGLGHSVVRIG